MRRQYLVLIGMALSATTLHSAEPEAKGVEFFEKKIRPVLVEQCYSCHSAEAKKHKGGLMLDTSAALLKGGDSGAALTPGKPEESLLLQALTHKGDVKMPPKGRLSAAVQADFKAWIAMGAPDPRQGGGVKAAGIDWDAARKLWSFQPIEKPAMSDRQGRQPGRRPISTASFSPGSKRRISSPSAAPDKTTLIRRVTFDLIGLPPTPEEIDAFLADESPEGLRKVVDRLLASPHYGERWARHWLDVARYAEDQAHTFAVTAEHRRRIAIAIGSSTRSIRTCPTIASCMLQIAADLMERRRADWFSDRSASASSVSGHSTTRTPTPHVPSPTNSTIASIR